MTEPKNTNPDDEIGGVNAEETAAINAKYRADCSVDEIRRRIAEMLAQESLGSSERMQNDDSLLQPSCIHGSELRGDSVQQLLSYSSELGFS